MDDASGVLGGIELINGQLFRSLTMDLQKRKLDSVYDEKKELRKHLPKETQEVLRQFRLEYDNTYELYKKQERALNVADSDVTQGTQNLSYLEHKGNGLFREIMNILIPDSKVTTAVPDKGARPGSASIRPPKPRGRRYTDNSRT
jgi:hypothetical protein